MTAVLTLVLLAVLLAGWPDSVAAQGGKQVKVVFEFRQSATQSRDAVEGSGRVVITDRGGTRSSGRVGVDSAQRRTQTSTGISRSSRTAANRRCSSRARFRILRSRSTGTT